MKFRIKRGVSLFMAAILMMAFVSDILPARAATIESSKATHVTIAMADRHTYLKDSTGKALGGSSWTYTANKDGITGPAYCIAHGLKSVPTGVQLPIKNRYETSPKTQGAFAYGYPQTSLADFIRDHNLPSLTEAEYGYATQVAIWASLGQLGIEGTAFTAGSQQVKNPASTGDAQQIRVFKAIQAILAGASTWDRNMWRGMYTRYREDVAGGNLEVYHEIGLEGVAEDPGSEVALETINGKEYYTIVYYVSSATPTRPNGNCIDVTPYGPTGTILVSVNNQPLVEIDKGAGVPTYRVPTTGPVKTNLNANGVEYVGKYKLCIPADNVAESGEVKLVSSANITQYEMYIAFNTTKTQQSYIIADPASSLSYTNGSFKWASGDAPEEGRLQVTKTNGTGSPLSGATFELRGSDNSAYNETTGENGIVLFEHLDPSVTYTLYETVAPDGFVPIEPRTVKINTNVTTYETVRNDNESKLRVKKVDRQNGLVLQGAVFEFRQIDGSFVTSGTTGFDGYIDLGGKELPFGSYTVKEITAPDGYLLDPDIQTVHWRGTQDITLTFTDVREPGILLNKIGQYGEPLEGAVFRVYKDGQVIDTVTTNYDGSVRVLCGLGEGYYEFEEISAPIGYVLDSTKHGIYLDPYDPAVRNDPVVTVVNLAKPNLLIMKYDAQTMRPIPDTTFEIYKDTALIGSYTTDSDGEIMLNVDPGVYLVKEIGPNGDYVANSTPQEIEIKAGDTTKILVFLNFLKPGIHLVKLDSETLMPLVNARFLIKKVGGSFAKEYTTDQNGEIDLTGLEPGAYTVEELAAPDGYLIDDYQRIIQINPGENAQFVFTNTKKPVLEVLKYDGTNYLPGATFRIAKIEDGSHYLDRITDINGKIRIENLEPGIYSVKEMSPPPGYILNDIEYHVELFPGKTSQLVVPNLKKPDLLIVKTDANTGLPLQGATYTVRKVDSSTVSTVVTDSKGEAWLYALDPGVYQVIEQSVPSGYLLDNTPQLITLEGGRTGEVRFQNYPKPKLRILKVDVVTGEPLPFAEFRVTKLEGGTVSEYITDSSGEILIENLDVGIYRVEEFMPPDGYLLYDQYKQIMLEPGTVKTLKFDDVRKPTLIITKTNALTFEPIPDTTYRIERETAAGGTLLIGTYRTDANGQIILKNCEPGWYVITETLPAPGYNPAKDPVTRRYLAPGENAYTNFTLVAGESGDISGNNIRVTSGDDFIRGYEILNYPLNSIVIRKVNAITGELLAGAVFELRQVSEDISGSSGTLVGSYTTDNSGTIVITGLTPGGYIVTEVKAPDNYLLTENAQQQVWLKPDGTSIVETTFANYPYGAILVTKVDALSGKPLPNARFRVTDSEGAVVGNTNGEFITDECGEIMIPNVKPGSYVVTELEAPQDYTIDTTPQTINVGKDGKIYKVSFKNQPAGALVIQKLDTVTKEPLEGAEFKVTTSSGAVVGTSNGVFRTDATGSIVIPNLPKGSYIVSETKAPVGYILENQTQTIDVDYGKTYTLEFFNKQKSGLQILKIDSETKQPLKYAKFTVYKQNGETIGTYETDSDGLIIIDALDPGWIKIVETKAPTGYVLDDTPKDVEITANQFLKVVFENTAKPGLLVRKVEYGTLIPLEGAEFSVKMLDGREIGTYRTEEDGAFLISELDPGWYVVTETKVPDGYILENNSRTVQITAGKLITLEFQNKPLASIQIKKVDEVTGNPLAGADFTVKRQNGTHVGDFTTGTDGTISIPDVEPGWYVISETKAPTGYILNSTAKTVEVKATVPTTVTFTNKPLSGIEIIKLDSTNNAPLSDAIFNVERDNGERIGQYRTDSAGKIIIAGLTEGTYIVSEIMAPDGYIRDGAPKTAIVRSGNLTTLEFQNKPLSSLQIKKVDEVTGFSLAGANFTVQRQSGELVGTYTTDNNGLIIIPSVEPGWYVISETKAPTGYIRDNESKTVEVKAAVPTVITFTNKPLTSLQIKKVDESTGAALAGAEFTVQHQNGALVGTYTTDSNGLIIIPNINPGWYVVKETNAPVGYIPDSTPKNVEVMTAVPTVVTVANKPMSGLLVRKVETGTLKPLTGAEFTVKLITGEVIGSYRTGSDGTFAIDTLEPGWYIVTETKAPDGYLLDDNSQTIQITHSKLAALEFQNKPLASIQIIKTDETDNKPLSGAAFNVKHQNGAYVGDYVTGVDGTIRIPDIIPGWYVITETKAPNGYILDNTPKSVEVKTTDPAVVTFTNKPLSGLLVRKVEYGTLIPLSGAEFSIKTVGGTTLGNYRTEEDGTFFIPEFEPGWYVIAETKAPDGYILNDNSQTIQITHSRLVTVEFQNRPLASIQIKKTDESDGTPLAGAHFTVKRQSGEHLGDFVTESDGTITVRGVEPGWYVVNETKAPTGYILDSAPKSIEVKAAAPAVVSFTNKPMSGLLIRKVETGTLKPLAGADFSVKTMTGETIGNYRTDASGTFFVETLEPGWYVVAETKAPDGYILDETAKAVLITHSKLVTLEFQNKPLASIQIKKTDEVSGAPLAGADFTVKHQGGALVGEFTTGTDGTVNIPGVEPGWYVISETKAPNGYTLDSTAKTVEVKASVPTIVTFTNKPLSGIEIIKLDAVTKNPLSGATFIVERDNGEKIGTYKTDAAGKILVPDLTEGTYIVSETIAPDGYILSDAPKTVVVKSGKLIIVEFENKALSGVQILKIDSQTKAPLKDAKFTVYKKNGQILGTYSTDSAGVIIIDRLEPGWYKAAETRAPDGYILDDTAQDFEITSGQFLKLIFENKPLASLQIKKVDENTGAPLTGANFTVQHQNGALLGTYTTDKDGLIIIAAVNPGWYIISETKAPNGYVLDSSPKTAEVKTAVPTVVTFTNKPLSGLQIKKIDSVTKKALPGAVFRVTDSSGAVVGTTNGEFKTDSNGLIYIPGLKPGTYIATEIRCPDGYIMDSEPKTIEVKDGLMYTLEFANTPIGGFQLLKLDEETRKAIPGVEFAISKMNGERIGTFTTDAYGIIRIPTLESGWYAAVETKTASGYKLDSSAHNFEMKNGQSTAITVTNRKESAILIHKIDAVTGKGIYGVKFLISDANGNPLRTETTDQNGYIFTNGLPDGKYFVREIEAAKGYILDNESKTFYVLYGSTTEITWKNTPTMGQIQITKKSADDNAINGFPKGTLLQGAVFEIYDRANNLVDTVTSDKNGLAVSKTLPLGRYSIREVKAPAYYSASQEAISAEIEFSGQIIRLEVLNSSVYTNVSISKKGYTEVVPGQQIRYDFKNIGNNSTVALDSFYWRDTLPTDAVRLGKIVTGTYSHKLNYKIVFKTNVKSEYRTLADNLSTSKNYTIDASAAALGLASNEYVTEFMVVFGRVPAGFKQVDAPYIYCDVLKGLAHEYRFTNKCDVGGLWGSQWIMANDRWVTVVFNQTTPPKLPRTGY